MASADFCAAIGSPHGLPSPESRTRHRPPRLSLATFTAHPPDLQHMILMDGGLRCVWATRPTCTAYYPIPVRRVADLLHASFRLASRATPLRFANPSPPSSWIRDLHPQVEKHAWQTKKRASQLCAAMPFECSCVASPTPLCACVAFGRQHRLGRARTRCPGWRARGVGRPSCRSQNSPTNWHQEL